MEVRIGSMGAKRVTTGAGCSGCFALPFSLAMTCGITGLVFGGISMSRQGSDAAALATFAACPAVTAALGTPIRESTMSMGCGEYEGGGGAGEASWSMTLAGPRDSASAWYSAHYVANGPWIIDAATVTLPDGRQVDALTCPGGAAPDRPGRAPDRDGERDGERDGGRDRERGDGERDGKAGKRR